MEAIDNFAKYSKIQRRGLKKGKKKKKKRDLYYKLEAKTQSARTERFRSKVPEPASPAATTGHEHVVSTWGCRVPPSYCFFFFKAELGSLKWHMNQLF